MINLSTLTAAALAPLLAPMLAAGALQSAGGDALQPVAETLVEASGAPGGAVALSCDGTRSEAVAGLRIKDGAEPIQPGDLWHAGSNTKAMTATLAARLVEQGVISWDATLGETLAGLDVEIHPDLAEVTLLELLSHRSGIMANAGLLTMVRLAGADDNRDYSEDRLTLARALFGVPPAGPRGTFLYSNVGYTAAGLMLETAAGQSYEALMEREVFTPLGMENVGWGAPGEAGVEDQPRGHAQGLFGLSAREPGARADNPPAYNSAGRAHMPLDDLLDFLDAHLDQPRDYLSAQSWTRLHTAPDGGDYALGWGVQPDGALLHAGSNTMWFIRMVVSPQAGCTAVSAVNSGAVDSVAGPTNNALLEMLQR
ncbi:MAG: serine hydrolase domain-containing protein [Oceanicaulis sp.]